MDNEICKTVDILFFGAGKMGKYWLRYCREFGIAPKAVVDNNRELCRSLCEGVMICSPDDLQDIYFERIFITCSNWDGIYKQLLEMGVEEDKIVTGRHNFLNHFLYYAVYNTVCFEKKEDLPDTSCEKKILLDLQNGLVLGGVESWTYDLAGILKEIGWKGMYLTTDLSESVGADDTYPVYTLPYNRFERDKDRIELCVETIMENLPCTIICNFPQYTFWSACIVKHLYSDQIKIIAIQHSDDPVYYEAYGLWRESIDKCVAVSSRIENRLLKLGMKKETVSRLGWKVNCETTLERTWSGKGARLQIGYAGRITTAQKRADLLPVLSGKLLERGIDFQMNIAGTGDYGETLKERIQEEGYGLCMTLIGHIDRKNISEFWRGQDIMISCSDIEGHSITQSEAMASGAVPVVTDVSGAEDDVEDGYNGFIVPAGDMAALSDRICRLYHNREELGRMGMSAYRTVCDRQKNIDLTVFWNELLRKVWES